MSPPPPGTDASGEETPKGTRRSMRRLGCVQSSQCGSGSGEPRVVWDCQSPDQFAPTATTAGTAVARPGRRLSPGKLTDQLDPADPGAKSCGQPETPPLVRIWLRERKAAATALSDGGAEAPNQADARIRSPLRSLNGPARKLRRALATAVAVDGSKAASGAAATGCSASFSSAAAADSAADAELFGKLAAVVCAQRRDVSVPASISPSKSPSKYLVNDSPDASFVIPLIEDMPGWSDQSSFGEASFSAHAVADGSSPALRAAAPSPPPSTISSCTMRVRRLQAPSFPAAMDVDCSPRASTSAGRRVAGVRSAVDRDAVVSGSSHARACADSMAVDGGSGRPKISGASTAATKVAASRTALAAAAAAAASPRVPVSSYPAGLRRSPRVLTMGGSSAQRLQPRASSDLAAPASIVGQAAAAAATAVSATTSADAAGTGVLSASGGVRRQLCLLTANSCGTAAPKSATAAATADNSEASIAASSAVPRMATNPSASAIASVAPKQTTYASAPLPRPVTGSATIDATMSCQITTTLPAHVQALPRGVQSRPAGAPAKLVNLWDSRHRSSVVLGKSAANFATVAELHSVAGGPRDAGSSVGASSSAGSQGSSGTGARCSSEEIARKKQEALERRMRKAAAAVITTVGTAKDNEKEAVCTLPAADLKGATPATEAVMLTVQAVAASAGLASTVGCCTNTAGVTHVAAGAVCTTDRMAGISMTTADSVTTTTGSSSQGQTRCSSEEIARKRQLALERKMKRAAASSMQQQQPGSGAPIGRDGLTDGVRSQVRVVAKGP